MDKMNKLITKEFSLGGKKIVIETGQLAEQADAAVKVKCEGTVVLVTVVSNKPRSDIDYFPLFVEYVERLYAGGIIKGSRWVKREGKPSDEAVLAARTIDRSIRPLFPKGFKNETQVVATILSIDHQSDPDVLSAIGASAALHISNIPWDGPIGVVRMAYRDGNYFVNPTSSERENSDLDLLVSVGKKGVVMMEGGADQLTKEEFYGAVAEAKSEADKVIAVLEELREEIGDAKQDYDKPSVKEIEEIQSQVEADVESIIDKMYQRKEDDYQLVENFIDQLKNEGEYKAEIVNQAVHQLYKKLIRKRMLKGDRIDGRGLRDVRPLDIRVDILPRTHGSAIFKRGKTQALTVTTLGSPSLKQLIEGPSGEETKRYIHHYFMPPYSVGETGRFGWPKRREVGHGALAEQALLPVIPSEEDFPYTIRLVSEILSSNGSTSMASACGSSLSLMDAGVPISSPVAGISIGKVSEGSNYVLMTDMRGIEDFNGDMDFKVTATNQGITAIQLDIKTDGLKLEIIKEAFSRAEEANKLILKEMNQVISEPRKKVSEYAPKIVMVQIPPKKIGDLIGPGGKTIKRLIEETNCAINVEDDGTVSITGVNEDEVKQAVERVKALTREVEAGEEFEGEVKRVEPFGAFVEFLPGKQGLVHVSKISDRYIEDAQKVLEPGQKVKVKLIKIDDRGRYDLNLLEPKI
jgi:polyribonucleotide nucleotidyltransferase